MLSCPNCGYCPSCGRSNYNYPTWRPQPFTYTAPLQTTTTTGTAPIAWGTLPAPTSAGGI